MFSSGTVYWENFIQAGDHAAGQFRQLARQSAAGILGAQPIIPGGHHCHPEPFGRFVVPHPFDVFDQPHQAARIVAFRWGCKPVPLGGILIPGPPLDAPKTRDHKTGVKAE